MMCKETDGYHHIPISARDTRNAGRLRRRTVTENHRAYRKRLDALLPSWANQSINPPVRVMHFLGAQWINDPTPHSLQPRQCVEGFEMEKDAPVSSLTSLINQSINQAVNQSNQSPTICVLCCSLSSILWQALHLGTAWGRGQTGPLVWSLPEPLPASGSGQSLQPPLGTHGSWHLPPRPLTHPAWARWWCWRWSCRCRPPGGTACRLRAWPAPGTRCRGARSLCACTAPPGTAAPCRTSRSTAGESTLSTQLSMSQALQKSLPRQRVQPVWCWGLTAESSWQPGTLHEAAVLSMMVLHLQGVLGAEELSWHREGTCCLSALSSPTLSIPCGCPCG